MRRMAAAGAAVLVVAAAPFPALGAPDGTQEQAWRVNEEQRVGPPAVEFGAVTDAAVDAAGRLWVIDGMSGELHVGGPNGLRRIAGPGRGPGELTPGAIEIVLLPGDTALVIEPQTRRMHRFAPGGGFVSTMTLTGEPGLSGGWRLLPDGNLAARIYPASVRMPDASAAEAGDPVREFDRQGRRGEQLAVLPTTESFRMGEGPLPIITLLAPQPLWDVDERGRVLVASTHVYEVRAHGSDGSVATVVSQNVDGGGIGPDMSARARELLRETLLQRRTPPPVAERMVSAASIALETPVIGGIMAGPGSAVWVQQPAGTADELLDLQRPGGPEWRVYDAGGVLIGTVRLPAGVQPLEWRGNRLVAVARDEVGRTSAIVLRVDSPAH